MVRFSWDPKLTYTDDIFVYVTDTESDLTGPAEKVLSVRHNIPHKYAVVFECFATV